MQFNSHSTGQDLCTYADKRVKTDSTSFPIAEKVLYANEGSRKIKSWIYQVYGGWIYDDKNNTDFPEATTNLESGKKDYALPDDTDAVDAIECLINGTWTRITPATLEQIREIDAEGNFMTPDNNPAVYRLVSNSIKLYPTPSTSVTSGLRVIFRRDISTFATTDTTKTPGFSPSYHEGVGVYIALQYAKINTLAVKQDLQLEWDGDEDRTGREGGYKLRIKKDYSQKFKEMFPPRLTVRDATQEYE